MPRSRRSKIVTLARTDKRVAERKKELIETIRGCAGHYDYIYVFVPLNMRTGFLKDVRAKWGTSRFVFGKNKVMQIALGKTKQDEIEDNIHLLSETIVGNSGLLFTNSAKDEVLEFFRTWVCEDYARSGQRATKDILLKAGPLNNFSHSMEPYLRKLGLPTKLNRGVILLERDHQLCVTGQQLTPEQANLLKLLDIKMSEARFRIKAMWHKGKFELLAGNVAHKTDQPEGEESMKEDEMVEVAEGNEEEENDEEES